MYVRCHTKAGETFDDLARGYQKEIEELYKQIANMIEFVPFTAWRIVYENKMFIVKSEQINIRRIVNGEIRYMVSTGMFCTGKFSTLYDSRDDIPKGRGNSRTWYHHALFKDEIEALLAIQGLTQEILKTRNDSHQEDVLPLHKSIDSNAKRLKELGI